MKYVCDEILKTSFKYIPDINSKEQAEILNESQILH